MVAISKELNQEMIAWRHHIHANPEIGFSEHQTALFVAELLKSWGIEVHEGIGGTGVVGVLQRGSFAGKKAIALRADMDCIPIQEMSDLPYKSKNDGFMHACGHDGHTASLLGAAKYLATESDFEGTVYFIFQPDEEHGLGALAMMKDGLFEKFPANEVYGYHNLPGLTAGKIGMRSGGVMASENLFTINIYGRGGHASSPHMVKDPVMASTQIIAGLQTIVSRTVNPLETVVISVTEIITDGARNVIPSQITIKGDYRTFSTENVDLVEERMNQVVNSICAAYEIEGDVDVSREFVVSYNSPEPTQAAEIAATALVGDENVIKNYEPKSFSEDFGYMADAVSGCYVFIGNGTEGQEGLMLHNPRYTYNDEILHVAAGFYSQIVEQQLS